MEQASWFPIRFDDDNVYLKSPTMSDDEYMKITHPKVKEWMMNVLKVSDRDIEELKNTGQRTPLWYRSRKGRLTGSIGASVTGHNPYTKPLKQLQETVENKVFSNKFTQGGTDMEDDARKRYEEYVQKWIRVEFHMQRKAHLASHPDDVDYKTFTHMCFRGALWELTRDASTGKPLVPVFTVSEFGLLIDTKRFWRGISADGIAFFNGKPAWVLEIKCPQANDHALYPNAPVYYYDQFQNNIHTTLYHFDLVLPLCDLWVFSYRAHSIDEFWLDTEYFEKWFLPRESRYGFMLLWPALAMRDAGILKTAEERKQQQQQQEESLKRKREEDVQQQFVLHEATYDTL